MISSLRLITVTAILAMSTVLISPAQADQPHMFSALESLRHARHQLEIAYPDKGGHRDHAIEIIDHAIAEVQAGIDAGR